MLLAAVVEAKMDILNSQMVEMSVSGEIWVEVELDVRTGFVGILRFAQRGAECEKQEQHIQEHVMSVHAYGGWKRVADGSVVET